MWKNISKEMTVILRHQGTNRGLQQFSGCWLLFNEVLEELQQWWPWLTQNGIMDIIHNSDKARFQMMTRGGKPHALRAAQGHSGSMAGAEGDLESGWERLDINSQEVECFAYGTKRRHLISIMDSGLRPGGMIGERQRAHVHLAPYVYGDEMITAGMRFLSDVSIYVDWREVVQVYKMFKSSASAVMTRDTLHPRFVTSIIDNETGEILYCKVAEADDATFDYNVSNIDWSAKVRVHCGRCKRKAWIGQRVCFDVSCAAKLEKPPGCLNLRRTPASGSKDRMEARSSTASSSTTAPLKALLPTPKHLAHYRRTEEERALIAEQREKSREEFAATMGRSSSSTGASSSSAAPTEVKDESMAATGASAAEASAPPSVVDNPNLRFLVDHSDETDDEPEVVAIGDRTLGGTEASVVRAERLAEIIGVPEIAEREQERVAFQRGKRHKGRSDKSAMNRDMARAEERARKSNPAKGMVGYPGGYTQRFREDPDYQAEMLKVGRGPKWTQPWLDYMDERIQKEQITREIGRAHV